MAELKASIFPVMPLLDKNLECSPFSAKPAPKPDNPSYWLSLTACKRSLNSLHDTLRDWIRSPAFPPIPLLGDHSLKRTAAVKAYLRACGNARSVNSLNRLHIRLNQVITPRERQQLVKASIDNWGLLSTFVFRKHPPQRAARWLLMQTVGAESPILEHHQWVRRWTNHITFAGSPALAEWIRLDGRRNWTRYSQLSSPRPPKRILLAWTGGAKVLMLPTPDFLQAARCFDGDILLLREPTLTGYREGVPGFGANFADAVRGIAQQVSDWGYSEILTIGGSGGALAAIASAPLLRPSKTLAIGTLSPDRTLSPVIWQDFLDQYGAGFRNGQWGSVHLIYGADHERDKQTARRLQGDLGVSLEAVPDSDHGVLYPLLKRGELEWWIKSKLCGQV